MALAIVQNGKALVPAPLSSHAAPLPSTWSAMGPAARAVAESPAASVRESASPARTLVAGWIGEPVSEGETGREAQGEVCIIESLLEAGPESAPPLDGD
jgi:hypothetical protein